MANLIPARYAQSTIKLIRIRHSTVAEVLKAEKLPLALLDDQPLDGTLDAEQYGKLFMSLLKASQHELQGGASGVDDVLNLSAYRLLYSYMLNAQDLGGAIQRATAYYARFQRQQQGFTMVIDGDFAVWQFNLGGADGKQQSKVSKEHFSLDELQWLPGFSGRLAALYTWHRLSSWMIGNFIDLTSLHIDYALLGNPDDYIASFRAPVYFNQDYCQLRFHRRYLALPIVKNETDLEKMLTTFPSELLRADAVADSTAAKVQGLMGTDFSRDLPSLEQAANRLHTTTATLHRRLRNEGTSYQMIKDNCRRDAAIHLLRKESLTGGDIAEKLGFSDASTFFRAFKKWTGTTPQEFVKKES